MPVQTAVVPAILPPTETGLTVIVALALFAVAQLPLCTTARYCVVAVRLVAVSVVVVFAMSVADVKLSVDDCHLTTEPVCPLNVKVVELAPAQTVAVPAIDPPIVTGLTVMVAEVLFAVAQLPLCTIARYCVVAVRLVAVKLVVILFTTTPSVAKLFVEYSQYNTVPVCPLKVSSVLLVPVQTEVLPARVPPTLAVVQLLTDNVAADDDNVEVQLLLISHWYW